MKDTIPVVTRAAFEAELIKRAWQDPDYKERLLKSPKAVIAEALAALIPNITLPRELTVTAHEESAQSIWITLPVNPAEYAAWLASGQCLLAGASTDVAAPLFTLPANLVIPAVVAPALVNVTAPTTVNVGPITPIWSVVNIVFN